jgi:hypothetical protein
VPGLRGRIGAAQHHGRVSTPNWVPYVAAGGLLLSLYNLARDQWRSAMERRRLPAGELSTLLEQLMAWYQRAYYVELINPADLFEPANQPLFRGLQNQLRRTTSRRLRKAVRAAMQPALDLIESYALAERKVGLCDDQSQHQQIRSSTRCSAMAAGREGMALTEQAQDLLSQVELGRWRSRDLRELHRAFPVEGDRPSNLPKYRG